jgi:hypothetical protein
LKAIASLRFTPFEIMSLLTSRASSPAGLYYIVRILGATADSERAIAISAGRVPSSERTPRRRVCRGSSTEIKLNGTLAEIRLVRISSHWMLAEPLWNTTAPVIG